MKPSACLLLLCAILLAPHTVRAQKGRVDAQDFPKPLGPVIDAEENARYGLFGSVAGFSAARVYGNGLSQYQLWIICNREDGVAVAEVSLLPSAYRRLYDHMRARVRAVDRGRALPMAAVLGMGDESWRVLTGAVVLERRGAPAVRGVIVGARVDTLRIRAANDTIIDIPHDHVTGIRCAASDLVIGGDIGRDRHDCRLFLAPTGRMQRRGEGTFTDFFVFFPTVWSGVSEHLMVGAGAWVRPASDSDLYVYGGTKVGTMVSSTIHLSLTLVYSRLLSAEEGTSGAYGAVTFGDRGAALTIGTPVAIGKNAKRVPHLCVGGELQVAQGVKLLSENLFLGLGEAKTWRVFLMGFRFFSRKEAVDVGFVSFDDLGNWHLLPWLAFSFSWDW